MWPVCTLKRQVLLTHWGNCQVLALISGRSFPQCRLALVYGAFCLPLQHQAWPLFRTLQSLSSMLLMHMEDGLQLKGGRLFSPHGGLAGIFAFAALSPCQGSSGPLQLRSCRLPLHFPSTAGALAPWLFCLLQARSKSELFQSLHFPRGSCFWWTALEAFLPCLEGLQACCPIQRLWCQMAYCHFSALLEYYTSVGQAQEHISFILGQEAQWSTFWKAEIVLVIDMGPTLDNTPWYHIPLFFLLLYVVSTNPHFSHSSLFGKKGLFGLYSCCCFLCLCSFSLLDCKRCFFNLKWKMHLPAPGYMCILLMLASISYETDSEFFFLIT